MTPEQIERFWARVDKSDGCWNWTAGKTTGGYGVIQFDKKKRYAHRLSWELANGEIPEGINIDHRCHNPSCVNPSHIRLATQKQNVENISMRRDNKSGSRGVYWSKVSKKWSAEVKHDGRRYYLGLFLTREEAAEAAKAKRNEVFTHNDMDRKAA